jgi:hypothetical protein
MDNPFKEGDKVTTKVKGQQVEAVVTKTWNNEVQVRTGDKALLWRTVKTVTLVGAATAPVTEPEKAKVAATANPPANSNNSGAKPPPLPATYPKPSEAKTKSGPALAPAKYERKRSGTVKKRKI